MHIKVRECGYQVSTLKEKSEVLGERERKLLFWDFLQAYDRFNGKGL